MEKILGFLLLVVVGIPLAMLGGVVLSEIWGWFISPTFGIRDISYTQAIGLSFLVTYFKIGLQGVKLDNEDDAPITAAFSKSVGYTVAYLVLWGVAAIWNIFI